MDATTCQQLFRDLAAAGVWQVPTLVQMRGAFLAATPAIASAPAGRAYRQRTAPSGTRAVGTRRAW